MPYKLLLRRLAASALHHTGILELLRDTKQPWRILMYHRITTPEIEGYPLQPGMYVSPEHFDMQMAELKRHYRVLPLDELVDKILKQEPIAPKTVAITFDDGWYDNYQFAFPILRKYELPATIFLATKYIGSEDTFWSDAIPFAIAQLRGNSAEKSNLGSIHQQNPLPPHIYSCLNACLQSPTKSHLTDQIEKLVTLLKRETTDFRETLAHQLLLKNNDGEKRSFLRWSEVEDMALQGIRFGSHTHSHIPATELNPSALSEDILHSLKLLEKVGTSPSSVFCYPEGAYTLDSQRALQKLGFSSSLSIDPESNVNVTPPLLGRIGLHDDISSTSAMFHLRLVRA